MIISYILCDSHNNKSVKWVHYYIHIIDEKLSTLFKITELVKGQLRTEHRQSSLRIWMHKDGERLQWLELEEGEVRRDQVLLGLMAMLKEFGFYSNSG